MDAIMFEEESVFESDTELIKKACKEVNEQLKDSSTITGDNILELLIKELGFDPLK